MVFGAGYDGGFELDITENRSLPSPKLQVIVRAPSGKIYICPGEDITGQDDQPGENSEHYRGLLLDVEKGNYIIAVKKKWRNDTYSSRTNG